MRNQSVQIIRDYLVLDKHEVAPPEKAIPVGKTCTIKGPLSMWEQGLVCGYLTVKEEPHVVVVYTERPTQGLPEYGIVRTDRVKKFRKIVEREFRL